MTIVVDGELPPSDTCHCEDCRRFSGHFFASTGVARSALRVTGSDRVTCYSASPKVRRGFCSVCGSSLFWDPGGHDWTAIAMGAFDRPTGTRLGKHIWVEDQGDHYQLGRRAALQPPVMARPIGQAPVRAEQQSRRVRELTAPRWVALLVAFALLALAACRSVDSRWTHAVTEGEDATSATTVFYGSDGASITRIRSVWNGGADNRPEVTDYFLGPGSIRVRSVRARREDLPALLSGRDAGLEIVSEERLGFGLDEMVVEAPTGRPALTDGQRRQLAGLIELLAKERPPLRRGPRSAPGG